MDVAASEFCTDTGNYDLDFKNKNSGGVRIKTPQQMIELYKEYVSKYRIVSIEDPFDQNDWDSYQKLTADIGTLSLIDSLKFIHSFTHSHSD
jgi:enolase